MGISIDLWQFDHKAFKAKLMEEGADNEELLDQILAECGFVAGDRYLVVNNEYYDGYSPYYALIDLLDSAFPKLTKIPEGKSWTVASHDIILDMRKDSGRAAVERQDIAERLGIKLKSEDDDDD
jgi:hypothetical protein